MKFEFDSNNATELRAVEAAVAVLLDRSAYRIEGAVNAAAPAEPVPVTDTSGKDMAPLVADVVEAQGGLEAGMTDESETDSAGQPWRPELHSSSRAKVADGTWKKKRGDAGRKVALAGVVADATNDVARDPIGVSAISGEVAYPATPAPPIPPAPAVPTPPAPQADGPVTMNDIWALVTNGKTTINVVLEAAQRMGFADLGKVAQTATAEQRAALLKELTT